MARYWKSISAGEVSWDETLSAASDALSFMCSTDSLVFARLYLNPISYDPSTDTWDESSYSNAPNGWSGAVIIGSEIWCKNDTTGVFMSYNITTDVWTSKTTSAPGYFPNQRLAPVAIGSDIYWLNTIGIEKYDTLTDTLLTLTQNVLENQYWIATDGTDLYTCSENGLIYKYNLTADTWTSLGNTELGQTTEGPQYYDGHIYCKADDSSNYHRFDISSNSWETLVSPSADFVYSAIIENSIYVRKSTSPYRLFKLSIGESSTKWNRIR